MERNVVLLAEFDITSLRHARPLGNDRWDERGNLIHEARKYDFFSFCGMTLPRISHVPSKGDVCTRL